MVPGQHSDGPLNTFQAPAGHHPWRHTNPENAPKGNAYFRRTYCLKELRWAIEYKVPIILAADQKDMANDMLGAFYNQAPADLKFLFSEQVVKMDRCNPHMWNGSMNNVVEKMEKFRDQGMSAELREAYDQSTILLRELMLHPESSTDTKQGSTKPVGKVPKLPKMLSNDVHANQLDRVVTMLVDCNQETTHMGFVGIKAMGGQGMGGLMPGVKKMRGRGGR
jgi:hypothetical protein